MRILKKPLQSFNLNILICSLYTLSGNHKVFKKFNLQNDIYLDNKNVKHFSNQIKNFDDFEELLKSSWLKQFSLYLIINVIMKLDKHNNLCHQPNRLP